MDYGLGFFDDQTCRLEPAVNPFEAKVLPMSPAPCARIVVASFDLEPCGARTRRRLASRHELYERMRRENPERWSGRTRNWLPVGAVVLNPERAPLARQLS